MVAPSPSAARSSATLATGTISFRFCPARARGAADALDARRAVAHRAVARDGRGVELELVGSSAAARASAARRFGGAAGATGARRFERLGLKGTTQRLRRITTAQACARVNMARLGRNRGRRARPASSSSK